ncbi:MAG: dihydroneopterin aldolase [Nitrospirota bacterium]
MDKIGIYQIAFDAHIGTTQEERAIPQPLMVDIELTGAINTVSDRLEDNIDYDLICRKIIDLGQTTSVNLIETLTEKIAQKVLEDRNVESIFVRVKKCNPPLKEIQGGFSVEIMRHQKNLQAK